MPTAAPNPPAIPTGPADDGWRGRALRAEKTLAIAQKEIADAKDFLMRCMGMNPQGNDGELPWGFVDVVQEAGKRLYDARQPKRLDTNPKPLELEHHEHKD